MNRNKFTSLFKKIWHLTTKHAFIFNDNIHEAGFAKVYYCLIANKTLRITLIYNVKYYQGYFIYLMNGIYENILK